MRKLFYLLLLLIVIFLVWQVATFPNVGRLATEEPETTAFMERRKRELARAGKDPTLRYRWVPYERISPYLRRAVLVSEDNSFYEHEGVDVEGLKEALRRDLENKRLTHGGSTITQQLAKNLYLSPSRNPFRKLKELLIAKQLESKLSKKRILEIYLNVVEMGERVYGAEEASRFYFDRSASGLTPSQAALLAGSLPNPRVMNPGDPNKRLRARQRIILSRMRRWGYTVEREVLTAKKPASAPESEPAEAPPEPEIDTTIEEIEQITEPPAEPPVEPADESPPPVAEAPPATATDTTPPPE